MENHHNILMSRAIEIAQKGGKAVRSNPLVGAVVSLDGLIISEGYHAYFGGPHAEVNAIDAIPKNLMERSNEMTIYVTLEPCCVYGKTPPCTDKIIASGIKKVVVGCLDPNPNVNGKGVALLRSQGIDVTVMNDKKAQWLIRKFQVNHLSKKPYVILKWVMSSDHYIGHQSKKIWLSNRSSQILSHKWRTEVDGILIGKNTALLDNPQLTARLYPGDHPMRILLDSTLSIPASYQLLSDAFPTIIINQQMSKVVGNKEYIQSDNKSIDDVLTLLFEKGIYALLIEGGTQVIQSLIQSDLWHEARVCTCQRILSEEYNFSDLVTAPQCTGYVEESLSIDEDAWQYYYNTISQ